MHRSLKKHYKCFVPGVKALDDVRNTVILLKTIRIHELCEAALKYVLEALNPAPISTSLGSMFDFNELGFIA